MAIIKPVGREMLLFQDNSGQPADNLVIASHGEYFPRPGFGEQTGPARHIPGLGGWISPPVDVSLHFYGPHKNRLKVFGLYTVMADWVTPLEVIRSPMKVRNYRLSKYQFDVGSETYESIKCEIDLNRKFFKMQGDALRSGDSGFLNQVAQHYSKSIQAFDVLTIRNRWWMDSVSLHDVFEALRREGLQYANIHCIFCRHPTLGPKPIFSPQ